MAASQGFLNSAFILATDAMLPTREILKQVTDIANETDLTSMMLDLGRKLPVQQSVYYNFINEPIFKLIDTTGATVTNNGTRTVTVASITAATSGTNRVGDLVQLPSTGFNVGMIKTVSTSGGQDTLVIQGVSGANLSITAGDKLSSFSMVSGEYSDSPANLRYGMSKQFNKVQIFRETSKITDIENAQTLEVEFNGQNKIIVKDQLEKRMKMEANINAAFIAGDVSDTTYSDASPALTDPNVVTNGGGGGAVQTTRGLDKYITAFSSAVTTAGALGSVALADFDAMADALIASRVTNKQYLVGCSSKVRRAFDVYLQNLNNSGLTTVRMDVPVEGGKKINTEVTSYRYSGFDFNFATWQIFDHPTLFSQTLNKFAYFLPLSGRVKTVGGGEQPNMQIRYYKSQTKFGNDMISEYHDGGDNPINPTGTKAGWIVDYKTIQGLEILGAQSFGRMKVLA